MTSIHPSQKVSFAIAAPMRTRLTSYLWLAWLLVMLGQWHCGADASAQSNWETSPYRVRVWIASDGDTTGDATTANSLSETLIARLGAVVGAAWDLDVEVVSPTIRTQLATHPEGLTDALIGSVAPDVLRLDKLYVVQLRRPLTQWHISVREFDVRTRRWGDLTERRTAQAEAISHVASLAIIECFSPLVRLENAKDDQVVVQAKAAALTGSGPSPAKMELGTVLQPIERFNNRQGLPRQIRDVKWTYLVVTQTAQMRPVCQIHSGLHNPLGGRSSIRTQRLAIVVRPRHSQTRLVLETKDAQPQPIVGCSVFRQQPDSDESTLLGRSDWRGSLVVHSGDGPLSMLFFKNGNQLLARLPMLAGLHEQIIVPLSENDTRLEAEGFLVGVEENLVDVVARRKVLAAQIRQRIASNDSQKASELLSQLRTLPTPTSLSRSVQQQQGRLRSENKRVQQRIDKLFGKTRSMLVRFHDPQLVTTLAAELANNQSTE